MESIGASERVMEYLDREYAPQLCSGRILPNFQGKVCKVSLSCAYHCHALLGRQTETWSSGWQICHCTAQCCCSTERLRLPEGAVSRLLSL